MKFTNLSVFALGLLSTANAAAIPEDSALSIRFPTDIASTPESNVLEKRKGGGGGGRSGGSSSSGSSSSGSSSGSSSSGSRGSSGSSGSSSSTSNTGGRTSAGSGVSPSYGGGKYYSGGASTPYRAGGVSPLGVAPYLIAGGALGAGAFYAHSLYIYPYAHPYIFHNQSAHNATNSTIPVKCVCEEYQECGCEDQTDDSYLTSVVGNGSASDMNATVARVTNINGTDTLVVNGTLANGTTASGGTDSAASSLRSGLYESAGWWVIGAGVVFTVWF